MGTKKRSDWTRGVDMGCKIRKVEVRSEINRVDVKRGTYVGGSRLRVPVMCPSNGL